MNPPIWTILIPHLDDREELLNRLLEGLMPQVFAHQPDVTLEILTNDGSEGIPVYRQRLLDRARSDYVSFIDDDDKVADDYVSTILPLLDGVDQVGFWLQYYEMGVPYPAPTKHSLSCGGWWDTQVAWCRDVSHLNPVRTELARHVGFIGAPDLGEDHWWAFKMRGLVHTEHFVDKVMYHYLHDPNHSIQDAARARHNA
jgi:hypothetical protein